MKTQFKNPTRVAYFLIMAVLTVKMLACRGTVPASNVTAVDRAPVGPASANPSFEETKPQIIERLIIKPKSLPLSSVRDLNIEVRSESEVWCERRCSQFSLLDEAGDENSLRLSAVKKTLIGHTTPGVLDIQQDLGSFGSARKKLEIMNVGLKGESVVLSVTDFDEDHPNFFALSMTLSNITLKGVKVHKGRFDNSEFEVLLAPGSAWPDFVPSNTGSVAFVMGSYFETRLNDFGEKGVFVAKKIIYPWP